MGLNRLKVKLTQVSPQKDGPLTVTIEGDFVTQFNKHSKAIKTAERDMNELRPDIAEEARKALIEHNINHPNDIRASVDVVDDRGSVLNYQFKSVYAAGIDLEVAEPLFERLTGNPDGINDYLMEVVVGKWNPKAFLNADDTFNRAAYTRVRQAIEQAAKEAGIVCPLETAKTVVVKPDFHTKRWAAFPDAADQQELTKVVPNTVAMAPKAA